jgi:cysteine desulfurase
MIYLDHNATTPIDPEVTRAMAECQSRVVGNPASQHSAGRKARQTLENAREEIAAILGIDLTSRTPDQLIFTSGGTEANHLALFGILPTNRGATPGHIAVSSIEHPSVLGTAEELQRLGWRVGKLPVNQDGVIDLQAVEPSLSAETRLVSVMLANNETGVMQSVAEIARVCAARGIPVHTDAAQVVGKLPVDFRALGVSLMSIAAHKFHGPIGIGALAVRHGLKIQPQLHGGFQQSGLRPGTESVALAVGMHRALELWRAERESRIERMRRLRDRFESRLKHGYPALVINGANAPRLPHTSNLAFVGLDRQALFMALDIAGVACSTGSACASGSSEPSPVLLAMACSKDIVDSSLRFSLGANTTEAEIDEAVRRILEACARLGERRSPAGFNTSGHAAGKALS